MKANLIRPLLASGKPTLGTRMHNLWPNMVEIVGHTGMFDYVEFLAEYAPFDLAGLENYCRAAELHHLGSLIKVDQAGQQYWAQRGIGAGFDGVVFADSRTVDDVRKCVQSVRPETPPDNGLYGAATRRFAYMGHTGDAAYVQALRDSVVVLMVEKQAAVDNLDELLSIPGIDMVQWGPADYSLSIGLPGERKHPSVKAAERKVIDTCFKCGIPPRAEIGSLNEAQEYLDLGVRHFSLGADLAVYYNWLLPNAEALRKLM